MRARDRLRVWREGAGLTREQAGRLLGCHASMVSHLEGGRRGPGRRLANEIEAVTRSLAGGPVKSTEWDEASASEEAAE
jgi:transcriptional regulator with XRE-family HTH domain